MANKTAQLGLLGQGQEKPVDNTASQTIRKVMSMDYEGGYDLEVEIVVTYTPREESVAIEALRQLSEETVYALKKQEERNNV